MRRTIIHTTWIVFMMFFLTNFSAHAVNVENTDYVKENTKSFFATKKINNNDVIRMSQILGALHHVEALCTKSTGMVWRVQMFSILSVYKKNNQLNQDLIQNFNTSYYNFSSDHVYCSPLTKRIMMSLIEEGKNLSARFTSKDTVDFAYHLDLSK